jgi:hypothetical protein
MTARSTVRGVRIFAPILAIAVALAMAGTASAALTTIYDNMPSKLPGSYASLGYECCQVSEFGGEVEFKQPAVAGKVWKNPSVSAVLDVWACEEGNITNENCHTARGAKFEWPITFAVYEVGPGNTVGAKLAAGSKMFKIPYRPSVTPVCNTTEFEKGGWYDRKEGTCYHGKATRITFPLKIAKLPEKAIISIAYNTSNYGAQPQHAACQSTEAGCPYDSLNVAVHQPGEAEAATPAVGSDPDLSEVFIASTYGALFCSPGEANGVFGPSGPCWNEEQPVLKVAAKEG